MKSTHNLQLLGEKGNELRCLLLCKCLPCRHFREGRSGSSAQPWGIHLLRAQDIKESRNRRENTMAF